MESRDLSIRAETTIRCKFCPWTHDTCMEFSHDAVTSLSPDAVQAAIRGWEKNVIAATDEHLLTHVEEMVNE